MSRNSIIVLSVLLVVFIILNVFRPGGLMAYFVPSICWATIALTTLYVCGFEKIRSWTNRRIALMALLVAAFQIFILIDAGLMNKFGKSPMSFTPRAIAINLTLVTTTLLGTELSRAYLTKNLNRKRPTLTLGLITILYTFINVSIFTLLNFQDPPAYSKFLGTGFLPVLTENLLATYLVLLSGPVASLAYRAPLQAFQWFSPILPDLRWGYEALLGVMVPTIGFIAIAQATTPTLLRKIGILPKTKKPIRQTKKSSPRGWLIVSALCVLTVWASTGLLGFYPTIVASGSMRPVLVAGDMAIVIPVDPSRIEVGDIIQYWQEGEMILHRVVEIRGEVGTKIFITKGDDNPIPDSDPVFPGQIRGKLIFTIPKLGWISIHLKTAIVSVWSFLSTNITLAYGILTTLTLGIIVYAYRNLTIRKWKRRW